MVFYFVTFIGKRPEIDSEPTVRGSDALAFSFSATFGPNATGSDPRIFQAPYIAGVNVRTTN